MTNVALIVPAVNEGASMPLTARVMREARDAGIVQRAVVVDGGSTDDTSAVARDHGIEVVDAAAVSPSLGPVLGKGDSLFRAVHSIDADHYVFLDADLGNVSVHHVHVLVQRVTRDDVALVKGGFVRVDEHGEPRAIPAGRVTEEVGRPLLARVAPGLAGLTQPLSGQVALHGEFARRVRFATGYGIEIAMLIDAAATVGEHRIAEADMGEVNNRWKPDHALNDVRAQVLAGASAVGVTLPEFGVVSHPGVVLRIP